MSLIIWVPLQDDLDRARFVSLLPEGWQPLNAWTGRDVYDPSHFYQLELTKGQDDTGKPVTRAILAKWKYLTGDRGIVRPGEIDFVNVADAAGHLGFNYFDHWPLKEPYAAWIVDTTDVESRSVQFATENQRPDES